MIDKKKKKKKKEKEKEKKCFVPCLYLVITKPKQHIRINQQ